ncbi:MAG: hypothetical protein PHT02_11700 [Tissierellia bacterium]|nr:hypothetical protein [Tissierellia bacterium]
MKQLLNLKDIIKKIIKEQINKVKVIELFVVTGVNEESQTLQIKQMNVNLQYDNVIFMGVGLGNAKGQILLPNINDIVLGVFLSGSNQPIVIGQLYDTFSQKPDNKNTIKKDEYLLMPKMNGSYFYINENGDIIFQNNNGKYLKLLIGANGIQSSKYYSSDNTEGATQNVTIDGTTLIFKDGIFVGTS